AEANQSPAEASAVYWLAPGTGEGMSTAPAGPATDLVINTGQRQFRYDPNTTFVAFATGDDNWFAQRLFAPGPTSSFTLPLNDLQAVPDSAATLKLRFWSNNDISSLEPDHHLRVLLNDQEIGEHWWDGASLEEIEFPVPAGLLTSTDNSLTLTLPGDTGAPGEDVYLDYVELTYEGELSALSGQLRFGGDGGSLTVKGTFTEPIVVNSAGLQLAATALDDGAIIFADDRSPQTYWVADQSQLLRPRLSLAPAWAEPLQADSRGADYVAIVADAPGFADEIETLLAHRQSQGLTTSAISVSQIYDEFGYGRQTPVAIRDFISYAVANWQPAPRFVLLVGDASYDIHSFNQSANRNLIPAQMIYSQFAGYVASDTWYTLSDGSLAPNVALGRLPVEDADQLEAVITKIIAYEGEAAGAWQAKALLVADDEPLFNNVSDGLAEQLGAAGYSTDKLYISVDEAIHDDIIADLEEGVGLLNYVGHGSIEVWGDEQVLRAEDATEVAGTGRFPIFTTFTCLNGYFNHPQVDALAETLLWVDNGGIVAAVAPSGRSLTTQQQPIADVFFAELLDNEAATLGEALMIAKVEGASNNFLHDVIHTFNLLGDPALRFQHPAN
ncbi:MAG: hypothetical protein KDE04_04935, partial [Anaerolineales bacterium]|nr:hypothetical protein [Anaerolineales bacterium]